MLRPSDATGCHLQGPTDAPARLLGSPGVITVQTHGKLRIMGYLGCLRLLEASENCSHASFGAEPNSCSLVYALG